MFLFGMLAWCPLFLLAFVGSLGLLCLYFFVSVAIFVFSLIPVLLSLDFVFSLVLFLLLVICVPLQTIIHVFFDLIIGDYLLFHCLWPCSSNVVLLLLHSTSTSSIFSDLSSPRRNFGQFFFFSFLFFWLWLGPRCGQLSFCMRGVLTRGVLTRGVLTGGSLDCRGGSHQRFRLGTCDSAVASSRGHSLRGSLKKVANFPIQFFSSVFHWKYNKRKLDSKIGSKIGSEIGLKIGLKIGFTVLRCLRTKLDEAAFSNSKNWTRTFFQERKNWTRIVPPKKQKLDENCATQKAKIGREKIGRNLSGTWRDPNNGIVKSGR